ncbi:MAG: FkbM family methyltransferase [Chromatiaceae bacterium]|nr:FkbM family methyltransferase [Chromatiaceae bacterium]
MKREVKIGDKVYSITSDDNYLDTIGDNFEPHMVELFRTLVGPDDVVADIGANIGLTGILFSTLARKVFAFEPSPTTYKILADNLYRAGIGNVEAVNLGLGSERESLTITFAKNNRSGGYVSDKIRLETGHLTEEIKIDTLDNYFYDTEFPVKFLKIDVEGFEQNVIKGGREFLRKHQPTVVMEMNHFCLDVLQRITIPDFLDFMRSVFPHLYAIDTDNVNIVDLHLPDRAYHVMYQHVINHKFPNLVAGFDREIQGKLDSIASLQGISATQKRFSTPVVINPNGTVQADSIITSVAVGEVFDVPVTLSNAGDEIWHGYGTHPVLLSYHWKNIDESYLIYDGVRSNLTSQVVLPNKSVKEVVRVVAPSEKGNYKLTLTVVQEGVCWFEDRGFICHSSNVTIF